MPQIEYRTAIPSDVADILDVMCDAPDDGITYMYRQFDKHREDIRRRFLTYFRVAVLDPNITWRIAVDVSDNRERVVAFSGWMRKEFPASSPPRTSKEDKDPKNSAEAKQPEVQPRRLREITWFDTINTTLLNLESRYRSVLTRLHLYPNPAITPHLRTSLNKHRRALQPSPDNLFPCWELCGIAISPAYQGQGIGTSLVRWGMQRAEEDGVVVFTGGETTGFNFYIKKLGFRPVEESMFWLDKDGNEVEGGANGEGWKQELGGVMGGMVWWDPKWKNEK